MSALAPRHAHRHAARRPRRRSWNSSRLARASSGDSRWVNSGRRAAMGELYMVCMYILFSYVAVASVHIVYSIFYVYSISYVLHTHTYSQLWRICAWHVCVYVFYILSMYIFVFQGGRSARDKCVYMCSIFYVCILCILRWRMSVW